jgi:hypothetical protein
VILAGRHTRIALILAIGLLAAGCADAGPTPVATLTTARPAAASTVAPPSSATPGLTASSSASGVTGGAVEDASLLDVLPASVGGVDITLEHQAFLDAVADPAFARNVRRAAFGVAVSGSDLVSGVVAELGPGAFSDAFFRDWRDTYNQGACGQSGGVAGNAETQVGGRTVYIATCAGGLRTYHTWLPQRGAIVSAFAVGDGRLGEALMEGLRP